VLKQILAAAALVVAASAAFASDASADRQLAPVAQASQAGNPALAPAPCSCCRR